MPRSRRVSSTCTRVRLSLEMTLVKEKFEVFADAGRESPDSRHSLLAEKCALERQKSESRDRAALFDDFRIADRCCLRDDDAAFLTFSSDRGG